MMTGLSPGAAEGTGAFAASGLAELTGVRWRFSADRPLNRGPVPAGDLLLVTDAEGSVYALDPRSGEVRWQHRHSGATRGVAAAGSWVLVDDCGDMWVHHRQTGELATADVLRAATGVPVGVAGDLLLLLDGLDHDLRAVDLRSGVESWQTGRRLLTAPVAVHDGVVVGALPWEGNNVQGGLQAVDLNSGDLLWFLGETVEEEEDEEDDEAEWLSVTSAFDPYRPAVAGGRVWATRMRYYENEDDDWTRCELAGFDLRTGENRYSRLVGPDHGARACCAVTAGEGLVYVVVAEARDFSPVSHHRSLGGRAHLIALDPVADAVTWSHPLDCWPMGAPVLAGGLINVLAGDGTVHCFDARTGERRWTFAADEAPALSASGLRSDWGEDALEEPTRLLPGHGVLYVQTATTVYALG